MNKTERIFNELMNDKPYKLRSMQLFFKHCSLKASGCVEWNGVFGSQGYGSVKIKQCSFNAHRISWAFANSKVPPSNMHVCHTCDNRKCVNPDHLFLGTAKTNIHDMINKGRKARGSRHASSKLTEDIVLSLRARHESGEGCYNLAREVKIDPSTMYEILKRKTWKHI